MLQRRLFTAAAAAALAAPAAFGQQDRTIKILVGFPPGGSVDAIARLIADKMRVSLTHVAYRGGAPAAQDLIGGQIPLMVDTASETLEHHKAGKVRILAVTGDQRTRAIPDVPTLKESGINVSADAFFGLYGPPGM